MEWVAPSQKEQEEMRKAAEAMDRHLQEQHDERRTAMRIRLHARVTGKSETNFFMGLTENLSEGGVFVATLSPPLVGERVGLNLTVDGSEAIPVDGEVRWLRAESDGTYSGCGVQFLDLSDKAKVAIEKLIEQLKRDPLLFED